jgi:hypothetical protein
MDMTNCPECGELAEVERRDVMESTDGPIEHAKLSCVQRHWFLMPVAGLERSRQPVEEQRLSADAAAFRVAPTRSR